MVNWISEAGEMLGFEVKKEKRRSAHGKIFQIDSMWFKNHQLFAFLEAEKRWELNHIIGHLICCVDYAVQEKITPFFLLVYLETETNHCKRLLNTWTWLTRMIPPVLEVRCLPICIKKNVHPDAIHASTITKKALCNKILELIK